MGKKICLAFNHLQYSDGVARAALSIANRLAEEKDCDVTLRPIFIFDPDIKKMISPKVKIKPLFGFWIRGMVTLFWKLPGRLIHALVFGTKHEYDIEVGFQHGPSTVAAVSSRDNSTLHYVWIHGYDSNVKLRKYYAMADKVICVSKMNSIRVKRDVPEIKEYKKGEGRYCISNGKQRIKIYYCGSIIGRKGILQINNGFFLVKKRRV